MRSIYLQIFLLISLVVLELCSEQDEVGRTYGHTGHTDGQSSDYITEYQNTEHF